ALGERRGRGGDEPLHRVLAGRGVGQVTKAERVAQLLGGDVGRHDSSLGWKGRMESPRPAERGGQSARGAAAPPQGRGRRNEVRTWSCIRSNTPRRELRDSELRHTRLTPAAASREASALPIEPIPT